MTSKVFLAAVGIPFFAIATFVSAADLAQPSEEERAAGSRDAVKSFATQLQGALLQAVAEGGPESAIAVCQAIAPEIAGKKASETGWSVGRTALRLRNPANAPDAWERGVLQDFQEKAETGTGFDTLEHFETTTKNGKPVFRYMKAIPTKAPCLACHGPNVSASVQERIDEFYPEDQAVGFSPGDLRGAFTIVQPLE